MSASLIPQSVSNPESEPVTAESIRRAVEDANTERQRINQEAGTSIPLHPMPEFHPVAETQS